MVGFVRILYGFLEANSEEPRKGGGRELVPAEITGSTELAPPEGAPGGAAALPGFGVNVLFCSMARF